MALRFALALLVRGCAADGDGLVFAEPFGDGMILQRGESTRIWGASASPGSRVKVTVSGSDGLIAKAHTTADSAGAWELSLPAVAASWSVTVAAADDVSKVELHDVAFGDVLLCGGQSNMGYGMCGAQSATQTPQQALDDLPELRLYFQMGSGPHGGRGKVRCNTSSGEGSATPAKIWLKTNATNAGGASAVCLLTAQRLFEHLGGNVPVGAVESCVGGTEVELWTPPAGELWQEHMVPLLPMTFKAALWDQGEADAKKTNATYYSVAFPHMISEWRNAFKTKDLPFIYVELPHDMAEGFWMAQRAATELPNVGFAVTTDVDRNGLHPPDKQDVANRLLPELRRIAYGEAITGRGPELVSAKVKNGKLALKFSNASMEVHAGILVGDDKDCLSREGSSGVAFGPGGALQYTLEGDILSITCPLDTLVKINSEQTTCFLYGPSGLPAPPLEVHCTESDMII